MTVLFHKASGAAAINETFSPNFVVKILQIKLTLASAGVAGEDFTADIDAVAGTSFDGSLIRQSIASASTMIRGFEPAVYLDKGDALNFDYENSGSVAWGLEIAFERVA
jgi:hypothetical protein